MTDMGILRVTAGVETHANRGKVHQIEGVMVGTGSEYTWLPRALLEQLGVPVERTLRFVTADGRVIEREMGYAIVHAGGTAITDPVIFAGEGDMILLGAHTVEGMNLRIELATKQLVPAGPVPAAAA
jgi:predicted aspartyl protease